MKLSNFVKSSGLTKRITMSSKRICLPIFEMWGMLLFDKNLKILIAPFSICLESNGIYNLIWSIAFSAILSLEMNWQK